MSGTRFNPHHRASRHGASELRVGTSDPWASTAFAADCRSQAEARLREPAGRLGLEDISIFAVCLCGSGALPGRRREHAQEGCGCRSSGFDLDTLIEIASRGTFPPQAKGAQRLATPWL
jgi:hypothetical protein